MVQRVRRVVGELERFCDELQQMKVALREARLKQIYLQRRRTELQLQRNKKQNQIRAMLRGKGLDTIIKEQEV